MPAAKLTLAQRLHFWQREQLRRSQRHDLVGVAAAKAKVAEIRALIARRQPK